MALIHLSTLPISIRSTPPLFPLWHTKLSVHRISSHLPHPHPNAAIAYPSAMMGLFGRPLLNFLWLKPHSVRSLHTLPRPPLLQGSLQSALYKAYALPFWLAGLVKLLHDSCSFVQPLILREMLGTLDNSKSEDDDPE